MLFTNEKSHTGFRLAPK